MVWQERQELAGGLQAVAVLEDKLVVAALAGFAKAAAVVVAVAADKFEWAVPAAAAVVVLQILVGLVVKQFAQPDFDFVTGQPAVDLPGIAGSVLECLLQFYPTYLPCKLSGFHGYDGVGPNCEQVGQRQLELPHLSFEHFEHL